MMIPTHTVEARVLLGTADDHQPYTALEAAAVAIALQLDTISAALTSIAESLEDVAWAQKRQADKR